jgi:O6-methylguanine-DNA--protein-cysteine methyltransferase
MSLSIADVKAKYTLPESTTPRKRPREVEAAPIFKLASSASKKQKVATPPVDLKEIYAKIDALPDKTAFAKRVLKSLCQVPSGSVSTYVLCRLPYQSD